MLEILRVLCVGALLVLSHITGAPAIKMYCKSMSDERGLEECAMRLLRVQQVDPQQIKPKPSCERFKPLLSSAELNTRSISPWWYNITEYPDRFPRWIPVAECVCQGCIINTEEETTYNSVQVLHTIRTLKRLPCPNTSYKYCLTDEYIEVPVACTCVLPREY